MELVMATYTPRNNVVQKYPPCQPDDYMSGTNCIPVQAYNVKKDSVHIFQQKNRAFHEKHDYHFAMKYGKYPDYNPNCHTLIERWKDQYARAGQSTFCKSQDDILGG